MRPIYHKEKQMSETNEPVVEFNPDAARSRTRAFFDRHKTKLVTAGILTGTVVAFVAGRKSKDVVESVDVDVNYADETPQD